VGPIQLVAKGAIYEVCPAHLELLTAMEIPFEVVKLPFAPQEKRPRATSH
jgi:hypothetical protein